MIKIRDAETGEVFTIAYGVHANRLLAQERYERVEETTCRVPKREVRDAP